MIPSQPSVGVRGGEIDVEMGNMPVFALKGLTDINVDPYISLSQTGYV